MEYQSPTDQTLVAQQPTSDWRDEQWVLGYGLYVNTVYHLGLQLLGEHDRAELLAIDINKHLMLKDPYYAIWSFKEYHSNKFDLLGNSLAILSGIASLEQSKGIISWVESSCQSMVEDGLLAIDLPPNFFPFIYPDAQDWHKRYAIYNQPGDYHNGGIWPFICAIYIAALVHVGKFELAEKKLANLTLLIQKARDAKLSHGFNEWIKSQTGDPSGQDWQTWSVALYLYAAKCVEMKSTFLLINKD
ncbi:glycoside hydrolase 100 family protein [Sphingobacterium sp. KU25419]|nr:glycoside hydrolase 100 family protein [Sphingobacterium sp. KU25419]